MIDCSFTPRKLAAKPSSLAMVACSVKNSSLCLSASRIPSLMVPLCRAAFSILIASLLWTPCANWSISWASVAFTLAKTSWRDVSNIRLPSSISPQVNLKAVWVSSFCGGTISNCLAREIMKLSFLLSSTSESCWLKFSSLSRVWTTSSRSLNSEIKALNTNLSSIVWRQRLPERLGV